jgi:hypothetical protein
MAMSTWESPEGAISAGCQGTALAFADPTPSDGYGVDTQTTWFGASITFDGPTTLTVWVDCSDGHPSFATS